MTKHRDERSVRRRQMRIGFLGIAVALLLAVTAGVVYLDPFGHREITVRLTTSGGLSSGDEVRIAGVRIGEVDAVRLHPDRVDVTLSIDDEVRLGDQTSAEVRLLTAIGGHYIAVRPAGSGTLPDNTVPEDRTTVPYTLSDVIADSGKVVEKVNGDTIAQTLEKVDAVLDGQPSAIREIIADMRDLTNEVGNRRDDLDAALALTDEYMAGLNTGRARLVDLLRVIGFVGAKAYQVKAEGVETIRSIGAIFAFVGKPLLAFTGTIEPPLQKVIGMVHTLQKQPGRIDDLIAGLRSVVTQISTAMGIGGRASTGTIDASAKVAEAPHLCVPSTERRC